MLFSFIYEKFTFCINKFTVRPTIVKGLFYILNFI